MITRIIGKIISNFRRPRITPVDAEIQTAADRISIGITQVFVSQKTTAKQIEVMQSFLLGYIATLAEEMGRAQNKSDKQGYSVLVAMIAAGVVFEGKLEGESLIAAFNALTCNNDFEFGQGGAAALEDFDEFIRFNRLNNLTHYFRKKA